jgi:hypothetical protein
MSILFQVYIVWLKYRRNKNTLEKKSYIEKQFINCLNWLWKFGSLMCVYFFMLHSNDYWIKKTEEMKKPGKVIVCSFFHFQSIQRTLFNIQSGVLHLHSIRCCAPTTLKLTTYVTRHTGKKRMFLDKYRFPTATFSFHRMTVYIWKQSTLSCETRIFGWMLFPNKKNVKVNGVVSLDVTKSGNFFVNIVFCIKQPG